MRFKKTKTWGDNHPRMVVSNRWEVYVLTTLHIESTSSVMAWGQLTEVYKPTCILDYKKTMGEQDKNDQLFNHIMRVIKLIHGIRRFLHT